MVSQYAIIIALLLGAEGEVTSSDGEPPATETVEKVPASDGDPPATGTVEKVPAAAEPPDTAAETSQPTPAATVATPEAPPAGRGMTRIEALQLAAGQNLDLLIQRFDVRREEANAAAQWSGFTPTLSFDTGYNDDPRFPPSTPTSPATRRNRGVNVAGELSWETPVGTSLALRADNTLEVDGDPTLQQDSELSLTVSQKLLRGGWTSGARNAVTLAELRAEQQRERFRNQLNILLADVEAAYWELAFTQADLQIKTRSRDRAQLQFEDTRANINKGLLAPGEIYVVEENVVFFEQQLVRSEENLVLAQRRLARLLQLPPNDVLRTVEELDTSFQLPRAQATVAQGLERNGEIAAERIELKRANVSLAFDENQILPTLDVAATFALNGMDPDAGEAWGETFSSPQPEGRIGLRFSMPLDYGPNFARVRASEATVKQQVFRLKNTEERVRFDIENLLVQLDKQATRLKLAQRQVELSELKLSTEQEKYKNGITTLTDVVRFQRDLDGALINVRRAQVELLSNRARLLRSVGTLHNERGIKVGTF